MKPILLGEPEPAFIVAQTNAGIVSLDQIKSGDMAFATESKSLHLWTQAQLLREGVDAAKVTNAYPINPETVYHLVQFLRRGDYPLGILPKKEYIRHHHMGIQKVFEFEYPPALLLAGTNIAPQVAEAWQKALSDSALFNQMSKQSNHGLRGMHIVPEDDLSDLIETYQRISPRAESREGELPGDP